MNINTRSVGHTGARTHLHGGSEVGRQEEFDLAHPRARALQHALNVEKTPVDQSFCEVPPMRGTKGHERSLTSVRVQGRAR